ncbi:hypothetical protein GT037_005299 [Alternaria burnsii]|uniref:C2H2-type domain-containing protein n=1 Tax=Alternaria burnsii TaxID=1187904 RepID=A0A8H7BD02_9PLEO|nr:uncharacterized protein GT037_005299 [Alternaria burnsii]KAF7677087.1 hypothetical protein GT037_005299 [Alternaria burnsii]
MSNLYPWGSGEYPSNVSSDENAGDHDNIHELRQNGAYQANPSVSEVDQRNGQEYLENQTHQHSDPVVDREHQQTDRYDHAPHSPSNYSPQLGSSLSNTAVFDNPLQQGAQCVNHGTHCHCHGQWSCPDNLPEVIPTFASDSGDVAFGHPWSYSEQRHDGVRPFMPSPNLDGYYTQQSHQHDSLGDNLDADWVGDFGLDTDLNLDNVHGMDFDAHSMPGGQVEYKEDGPWSPEKQLSDQFGLTAAQLSLPKDMVGASETSHASQNSDCISNSASSNTGSTGGAEDFTWGGASVATLRPDCNQPGSLLDRASFASNLLDNNRQGQRHGSFMQPTNSAFGQQGVLMQPLPDRTAVQEGSRKTSYHFNSHLHVPVAESHSSRPSSPAASTTSDVLGCPDCPAKFSGIYRQGNYGRHKRQKHRGPPVLFSCANSGCDKTFQRADARVKHYRRHHPELLQGCH